MWVDLEKDIAEEFALADYEKVRLTPESERDFLGDNKLRVAARHSIRSEPGRICQHCYQEIPEDATRAFKFCSEKCQRKYHKKQYYARRGRELDRIRHARYRRAKRSVHAIA